MIIAHGRLPAVPDGYHWLVEREEVEMEIKGEIKVFPKIHVMLMHGETRVQHGRIDVEFYGDSRAVIELAQDIYRRVL